MSLNTIERADLFNNRELATVIWLMLFSVWILTKSKIRKSIAGVFRALLNWKIVACVVAMVLYTATVVATLYAIRFWQLPMIKDTVLWFCFTALVMVARFSTSRDDENILRRVLVRVLQFFGGGRNWPA